MPSHTTGVLDVSDIPPTHATFENPPNQQEEEVIVIDIQNQESEATLQPSAAIPETYTEWNRCPKPAPREPLACLSLQERVTLSKVRTRIAKLKDPVGNTRADRASTFLIRQTTFKEHPFVCPANMLRQKWGFSDPKPGETEEGDGSKGADNDWARAIMVECELQEQLNGYRIRYHQEREHSLDLSPTSTSPRRSDWIACDNNVHPGLTQTKAQVDIKTEARASSCPPLGCIEEKQLEAKTEVRAPSCPPLENRKERQVEIRTDTRASSCPPLESRKEVQVKTQTGIRASSCSPLGSREETKVKIESRIRASSCPPLGGREEKEGKRLKRKAEAIEEDGESGMLLRSGKRIGNQRSRSC